MRRAAAVVVLWLAGAAPLFAQGTDVVVKTIEPEVHTGKLKSLSLTSGMVLRGAQGEHKLPAADLVRLTTGATAAPPQPEELGITLNGGETFFGRPVSEEEPDRLSIESRDLGRLHIPLDVIANIETTHARSPDHRAAAVWFARGPTPVEDRMLLTNGDVLEGFIARVDAEGIHFDGTLGTTFVPHRLIVAARLAAQPAAPLNRLYAEVGLQAAGRITVTALETVSEGWKVRLRHGPELVIRPDRVTRVEFFGGRWEWLSAHTPISVQHTPMLSLDWDYQVDRNVRGGPLIVAGDRYERGIGVHSRTSLIYDLKGEYKEFVTLFGMDDDSGPLADVTVHVFIDGQRRFQQQGVRRGRLHGPVRLDVTRANRVELITDFGDNGDIQDRLNWIETALIR